jgi:DNA-binding CsgD family transcriptional regulator
MGRAASQFVPAPTLDYGFAQRSAAVLQEPAMNKTLRNTGVDVLGDMPWGSHVCVFYESSDDLLDTVIPFLKTGLESNEYCLWALSDPLSVADARTALRRRISDFDRHVEAGRLELVPGRDWYLQNGQFDLPRVIGAWEAKMRAALDKGFDGLRVSGNAFWLHTRHWNAFCDYECALNQSMANQRMTALCTYPIAGSGAAEVLEVARAHHFAVARRNGNWEVVEHGPVAAEHHSLTLREREVLWWAAQGKAALDIAGILRITKRTVDEHIQNASRRLGAANRTQAVAIALRERLIRKTPPAGTDQPRR